ncbi:MAG: phosphate butyryltransferase [Hungatella sp.]|jgi:phosphate butyryltransferase|nr:phosphate butyryltransferase [Hungatella sp.]
MMQITHFNEMYDWLKNRKKVRIAIAGTDREEVRLAAQASSLGLAEFILIGNTEKIRSLMIEELSVNHDLFEIYSSNTETEAAKLAVSLTKQGAADIPMKGLIQTSVFMKAVLNRESGLKTNSRISQITLFENKNNGITFLTDCAVNLSPELSVRLDVIKNAVTLSRSLGVDCPKVALLGAVETVNESMPDTVQSAVITQMNRRGQIKDCVIDGPLSLDNAISMEAAQRKGIDSPVAGRADILIASSLQEANTLSKSLHFYAGFATASVIMGTEQPFVMTSRTDAIENKLNSIAVTCYYNQNQI